MFDLHSGFQVKEYPTHKNDIFQRVVALFREVVTQDGDPKVKHKGQLHELLRDDFTPKKSLWYVLHQLYRDPQHVNYPPRISIKKIHSCLRHTS